MDIHYSTNAFEKKLNKAAANCFTIKKTHKDIALAIHTFFSTQAENNHLQMAKELLREVSANYSHKGCTGIISYLTYVPQKEGEEGEREAYSEKQYAFPLPDFYHS